MKLEESFYQRPDVVKIALELLGKVLFTRINKKLTAGVIVAPEAYTQEERGCHAYRGMTERNRVMFGAGGVSYVYLCYGVHNLFNVVTNVEGVADAVLVRALEPHTGRDYMIRRMNSTTENRIS